MSDVSGIPYMGPMGMGNFFTSPYPGLSGGNLSAGQIQSTYMPEVLQGQNTLNNLYASGGGFGQQTNYYSGLGAGYSAAGMSPYGIFTDPGYGGGGGGASPYQTSPNVWDTGAAPFLGGGGSSGFGGSIYGGGGGAPAIDWGTLFGGGGLGSSGFNLGGMQNWAGNWNMPQSGPQAGDFGGGMFGGLAGGMGGANQGPGNAVDWTHLFGGGGAKADPYQDMAMPGGLNQPMATPQQQPLDYGSLFGQGVGGTGGAPQPPSYTSGIAPDETGGRTFGERFDALGGSEPMTDPFPGMTMPGGLNSPMSTQLQQPVDYGSLFGQSVGGTSQPWPADSYNPSNDQPSDPRMDKPLPGNPYTDPQGGGVSAADLGEQARQKLAELVAKPVEPAMDPNAPPAEAIPLPQPRPEGADAPAAEPPATPPYPLQPAEKPAALPEGASRPPGDIKQGTGLRDSPTLKGVNPRLVAAVAGGSTFLPPGYTVEAVSGVREGKSQSYHSGGRAADFKIIGPDGKAIPHKGEDTTGMYTMLAQGVKTWVQQNDPVLAKQLGYGGAFGTQLGGGGVPDLMHYDLGGSRGQMRPEVQFGNLKPLSAEEQRASLGSQIQAGIGAEAQRYAEGSGAPLAERSADATVEQRSGVNQGQNITPPPADIPDPRVAGGGFNALDAAANAPVKHSGLELARANIDTPIEKIAMERGGQQAVDQVSSMAVGMTPRQLMQSYGGMFMSRAEPLFQSLGITRQDFEKATSMPPTRQDLKMRFGGDFGGMGGELPSAGSFTPFEGFRQSADFENRTNEQLGRDQLAELQTRGAENITLPEVASTPLGNALGLEMLTGQADAAQLLTQKYGPEALWAAQGQAQFPQQGQTQPLGNGDVSRMPYTQQSPVPDASFPVQLYDDPRYGQAQAPSRDDLAGTMADFQSPANDYSTFQQQPFIPPWQASIPSNVNSPELREAIQQTAQQQGVKPEAVAGVVNTEDPKWDPRLRDPDSSYVGLTQMGPGTWKAPGMPGTTWADYSQRFTGPEQIQAYSQWLDSYGGLERAKAAGIDVSALPAEAQAALLQGLQFSPNAGLNEPGVRDWLTPYAQGDASMATTLKLQADFLNEHPEVRSERPTMGSMTDYYRRLMADQIAGADRRWPQQQLFNIYYPTQMPFEGGR